MAGAVTLLDWLAWGFIQLQIGGALYMQGFLGISSLNLSILHGYYMQSMVKIFGPTFTNVESLLREISYVTA